jgi:hypothetical protein
MTEKARGPIREEDFVGSIADALQYMAVYHPPTFVRALAEAYGREESPAAKDAIGQILANSRLSAFGRRPICQHTGTVNAFVKVGMGARIARARAAPGPRRRGCAPRLYGSGQPSPRIHRPRATRAAGQYGRQHPGRGPRRDGGGSDVEVTVAAKGSGSENKARYTNLAPAGPNRSFKPSICTLIETAILCRFLQHTSPAEAGSAQRHRSQAWRAGVLGAAAGSPGQAHRRSHAPGHAEPSGKPQQLAA